jgi:iron complex transport system substrate-binding protein
MPDSKESHKLAKGKPPPNLEKILQVNPDVLLVVNTEQTNAEQFKSEPFWNKLKATQNKQVYVFDYYGLVNPGSLDKVEEACTRLREVLSAKAKV